MAADIYVNTDTGTAGGTGTAGDPVDSMATVWANPDSYGTPPFTIYCSGAAVDNAGTLDTASNNWWARSFTIIGDASTAAYDSTKYKLIATYRTQQQIDPGAIHEFKNIQFKTTGTKVFDITRGGGAVRVIDCSIWFDGVTTASSTIELRSDVSNTNFIATNLLVSDALQVGNYGSFFNTRTIAVFAAGVAYTAAKFFNLTIHITKNTAGSGDYAPIATSNEPAVFKNCILLRDSTDPFFYGQPLSEIRDSLVSGISTTGTNVNNDVIAGAVYDPATLWADPANGDYTLLGTASDAVDKCPDVSAENGGITTDIAGNSRVVPWDRGVSEYALGAPHPGEHEVTDPSQAADPNCIYFGQVPAIEIGDQFSYKTSTETNGWGVSIDSQGYPIIDSGGATGTDSFIFSISRDSGSTWEPDSTWTFTIAPPVSGPYPGSHTVTDLAHDEDSRCVYYGQVPAIKLGDIFSYKQQSETYGWGVTIDDEGYPVIDAGAQTGPDSFLYAISRDDGATWGPASEKSFIVAAEIAYVNPMLTGGAPSGPVDGSNPPSGHSIANNEVRSGPIQDGWETNPDGELGRSFLVYRFGNRNPGIPVGAKLRLYVDIESGSSGVPVEALSMAGGVNNIISSADSVVAPGTRRTCTLDMEITGEDYSGNIRMGTGIGGAGEEHFMIRGPIRLFGVLEPPPPGAPGDGVGLGMKMLLRV